MAVDLHIHTNASGDGEFSPKEIIRMAKENDLQTIAIADHDTVRSVEEAIYWGEQQGIEVIPACEFSAIYRGKWLHILGYLIDYKHPDIADWCSEIENGRWNIVDDQINKLREVGFYLEKDSVLATGSYPMPASYAKALFADPRNYHNPLLNQYRSQKNYIIRFSLDWLVTGRPYKVSQYIPDVKEVIRLVLRCGGVPVLAHPAATIRLEEEEIIDALLKMGLVGIEAFTTWHTREQEEYYYRYCQQKKILVTCGSDFHGRSKPDIRIGQVRNNGCDVVANLKQVAKEMAILRG